MIEEIQSYLDGIEKKLTERFDNREKLLLLSRELIRVCGETISLSHRQKKEEALKKYEEAIQKAKEIEQIVNQYPELLYGDVGTSFQELAEASVVINMYFGGKLYLADELGIPDMYYVLGIADAVGEMRRAILEFLRKGDYENADKFFNYMETIYEELWKFEYPKSLIPGLRQKIDALRRILEETRHDLFLAKLGKV
ncbi:haloacid dehalogenase [Acidianus ambivalens]|uniref:Haloacid dehalogenase n=1 Tax=Acidianus ambivalens TaxID=2283 RepID=A0A650CS65_ACIAM|nr:haloacid dehalogenase [Acidianus ambivalens]MQL55093.1 haloacid dehalogenase [Acidianus ambivalens]QGR20646.1 haloacid dehalogenase [Acidianus ambivalens]